MTRIEYDLLREQEPHLKLPTWEMLDDWPKSKESVKKLSRDEVFNLRVSKILMYGFSYYDLNS